jgi:hypothetical protein
MDVVTGSSLPSRILVRSFPLFQISYLTYLSFSFRNIYTVLICIDTMRPSFLVCIRYNEIGSPAAFIKSLPLDLEHSFYRPFYTFSLLENCLRLNSFYLMLGANSND